MLAREAVSTPKLLVSGLQLLSIPMIRRYIRRSKLRAIPKSGYGRGGGVSSHFFNEEPFRKATRQKSNATYSKLVNCVRSRIPGGAQCTIRNCPAMQDEKDLVPSPSKRGLKT